MIKKAAFSLEKYRFTEVIIQDINNPKGDISIVINPSGTFYLKGSKENEQRFELVMDFSAFDEKVGKDSPFVKIKCVSDFAFTDVTNLEEIPPYFYKNSIAIVFPFIRAFVSTVTLLANVQAILLPTMNLASLESTLKENTIINAD